MMNNTRIEHMIITINDVRAAGHCAQGARAWFEGHGLDFRVFLRDGIPASRVLALGDGLAEQVICRTLEHRNGQ